MNESRPARERAPFLEVEGIVKQFDGVKALAGVDLAVFPGEVLCLAG